MKIIEKLKNSYLKICAWLFVSASIPLRAEIPASDDFIDGADGQDGIETLYVFLEKFSQVIVLAAMGWIVILIMKGAGQKYNEISDGKGTYVDLAGHVIGGVAVVALGIVAANWIGEWVE